MKLFLTLTVIIIILIVLTAALTQTIISANILTIAGVLPENNRNWSILAGLINKLEKRKSYNAAYECSQLEAELLEALLRG